MKKKKENKARKVIIFFVLFFLAFVVTGLLFLNPQEELIIYEEVCEKENIFLYKHNVSVIRIAENEFKETYDVFNNSYIKEIELKENQYLGIPISGTFGYYNKVGGYTKKYNLLSKEFLRIETTCTQIEVDEIEDYGNMWSSKEYYDEVIVPNNLSYSCDFSKKSRMINGEEQWSCDYLESLRVYLKKDLTIDWLNENAECVKGGIDDITIPCEDLSCFNRECSKWKLNNYIMELK